MDQSKRKPKDAVVAAFMLLMRNQQAAVLRIERSLRRAGLPPYSWYDALWELERAGDHGLRPFEIERQMLITQSNISRLIDKLQAAELIERCPCDKDARGQIIRITAQGRAMRARMWPVYAAAIEETVGAHLSEAEADTLADLLKKLPSQP